MTLKAQTKPKAIQEVQAYLSEGKIVFQDLSTVEKYLDQFWKINCL